jgi:CHU_C Type IX secretion signal domain
MKKLFVLVTLFFLLQKSAFSQLATWDVVGCGPTMPTIDMVLVDACGNEGETEFVIFTTGSSPYSPSSLSMTGSSSMTSAAGFTGNAAIANQLNVFTGGCSPSVFVAAPNPIPANAKVMAFPSSVGLASLPPPNLANYCGTGPIYVLSGNYGGGTNGFFVNGSAGCTTNCIRTLIVDFGGGCTVTSTYDRVTFPTGNGVNIKPGGVITNPGDCFPPPPFPPSCTPPAQPTGYSCNNWTVSVYEDGANFNFTNFKGYYTTNNDAATSTPAPPTVIGAGSFGFSTLNDGYTVGGTPSSATGYIGCPVPNDGFSIWAKKTCFPCGYYKIVAKRYDDEFRVRIDQDGNGTVDFTIASPVGGCTAWNPCNQVVWQGFLNNDSKIDLQAFDFTPNGLDFILEIDFLIQPLTLTASNDGPVCPGSSINVIANITPALSTFVPTPPQGPFSFNWTGPNGYAAVGLSNAASDVGTYTVSIGNLAANCPPITASTVVQGSNANFTPLPDITICANTSTPLQVVGVPPPSGSATFAWSGTGLSSTSTNPTSVTLPAPSGTQQTYSYTVTVTDGGCTWVDNFTITVVKPPTQAVVTPNPITICSGSPLLIPISSVQTGLPFPFPATTTLIPVPTIFTVTGPNGFSSVSTFSGTLPFSVFVPPAVTPTTPGTYTYQVLLALAPPLPTGCASLPLDVTVNIVAASTTLTTGSVCQGGSLSLNTLITAGSSSGTWSGTNVIGTSFVSGGLATGNYTVTFTPSGTSCNAPVTTTITVNPSPNPNTTQTGTICGTAGNYAGTVTLGVDAGFNYTWSAGVSGAGNSVTVTTPGIYTVTVSNGSGCSTAKTFNVVANPNPTPTIQGPSTLCNVSAATLSVTPSGFSTYSWTTNGIASGNSATLGITGPGLYALTVSSAAGCIGTATKTIIASTGLNPQLVGNQFICKTNGVGSTTLSLSNGPFATYNWLNSNNVSISQTATATIANSGNYTVTVSDAQGCTGAVSVTINEFTAPTVAISGGLEVCPGQTTTLSAPAGFTYKWNFNNSTATNINVPAGGPYVLTITDGNGCTATDSKNVTTYAVNTPSITGSNIVCANQTTPISVTGGTYTSYLWSPSNIVGANPTVGAGTYFVTATDNNNCKTTASKTISTDNISVAINGNPNICPGSATTLSALGSFATYNWSVIGQNGSSIAVTTAGTYSLTVSNNNNCTATNTITVNTITPPTVNIVAPTNYCEGTPPTLTTNPSFNNYNWSGPNNFTSVSSNINATGTGSYSVTVSNTSGCTNTATINLTENKNPKPTIAGSTSICAGASTTLDAGSGFSTYKWSNNNSTSQTAVYNAAGVYTVTVTDNKGCQGTATVTVTAANNLNITITGNDNFCPNGKTTLNAGAGFTTYLWSDSSSKQTLEVTKAGTYSVTVSNGTCTGTASIAVKENAIQKVTIVGDSLICEGQTGVLITNNVYSSYNWNPSGLNQTFNYTQTGKYSVTVTDANGCTATDDIDAIVNPTPKPAIVGKNAFCENTSTDIAVGVGFDTYDWSSGEKTAKITVDKAGLYKITVTKGNCVGIDSINMIENKNPTVVISPDVTICSDKEAVLQADGGSATYEWSNGEKTPTINVNKAGQYKVTVTNAEGCTATKVVNVAVNPVPVPIFDTPNTFCLGEVAVFKFKDTYANYYWSNGKTTDTIQVFDTNNYSVTVSTAQGCTAVTSKAVTFANSLSPQIIAPTTFCDGTTVTLTLDATYATYKWSDGSTNPTLTVSKSESYSVEVTSASGCKGVANILVTKVDNPLPAIVGSLIICGGKSTTLSLDKTYKNYLWSNGKTTAAITVDTEETYTVTVTSNEGCSGTATATVSATKLLGTLTDTLCKKDFLTINGKKYDVDNPTGTETLKTSSGCDSVVTIQLYFRNNIEIALEGANAVCKGDNATTITVNANGYNDVFDLNYQENNGVVKTISNVKNGDKINVAPVNTTTYKILSTTINNGVCTPTYKDWKINVNEIRVNLAALSYNGLGVSCNGKNDGEIKATATQGSLPYVYLWSNGEKTPTITQLNVGKYTVTVTDDIGCTVVDSTTLNAPERIELAFKTQNPLCASFPNGSVVVTDLNGGAGGYSYSLDGGKQFLPIGAKPYTINGVKPGNYTLIVRDVNDCRVEESVKIEQGAFIKVDLGEDKTINFGDSVVITPTADFFMKSIAWTNTKYLSCDTCQFPFAKPKVSTEFKVTVFDNNGCVATDNIWLFVVTPRRVFVPNIFTPGGDGNNDYIKPFLGDGVLKVNFFRIYDRWGDVVFEDVNFTREQSQEATRGWDGKVRGAYNNNAVFTYGMEVEFIDGEKRMYKGDITLLKQE